MLQQHHLDPLTFDRFCQSGLGGQFQVPHKLPPHPNIFSFLFNSSYHGLHELVDKSFCTHSSSNQTSPQINSNQWNQRFQREKLVTKKQQQRTHGSNCPDPEAICSLPVEFKLWPLPRQVPCASATWLRKLLSLRCWPVMQSIGCRS